MQEKQEQKEEKKEKEKPEKKEASPAAEKKEPVMQPQRQERRRDYYRKSDNPDVLYGREFDGEYTKIEDISEESGEVIIHGQIIFQEAREIRNERTIITFAVTDFTDTISSKLFVKNGDCSLHTLFRTLHCMCLTICRIGLYVLQVRSYRWLWRLIFSARQESRLMSIS